MAVSSSGCGEQLVSSLLAVNAAKALADNTDPLDPQFAGKLRQIFLSEFIFFWLCPRDGLIPIEVLELLQLAT